MKYVRPKWMPCQWACDRAFYDPFINFFFFFFGWEFKKDLIISLSKKKYMHLMDMPAVPATVATILTIPREKKPNNRCNYSVKDPSTATILKPIHFVRNSKN